MFIAIIAFIIILGVLVLFHELGHFVTARIFKVKAEEFGFGYPPRIFGLVKDKGKWKFVKPKEKSEKYENTVWSLNWIPVGGFVKIKGENENQLKEEDSFGSRKVWQRAVMLFSGVLMNVILCIILLAIAFNFGVPSVLDEDVISQAKSVRDEKIQIISVNKSSPAQEADLRIGDVILSLDGKAVGAIEFLQNYTDVHTSEIINLKILRLDKEMEIQIMPQVLETSNGKGVLGIGVVETGLVVYPWYLSLWKGAVATYNLLIAICVALFGLIKSIIGTGEVSVDIAGPIGIAVMTGQFARMGIVYLIQFAALLTINLAIINILPFPALDGGRLLFLLIEKIRGRKVNQKIEALVHNIGFIILMILIVFVTYRDVARWGGQIIDKIF